MKVILLIALTIAMGASASEKLLGSMIANPIQVGKNIIGTRVSIHNAAAMGIVQLLHPGELPSEVQINAKGISCHYVAEEPFEDPEHPDDITKKAGHPRVVSCEFEVSRSGKATAHEDRDPGNKFDTYQPGWFAKADFEKNGDKSGVVHMSGVAAGDLLNLLQGDPKTWDLTCERTGTVKFETSDLEKDTADCTFRIDSDGNLLQRQGKQDP